MEDLDPHELQNALTTQTLGVQIERYPVVVSTDAAALEWMRKRNAPAGALVIADHEIAARTRRGRPWASDGGLAAAVIIEPTLSEPQQDVLWAMAMLAIGSAYRRAGFATDLRWPETLAMDGREVALVRTHTHVAPGRGPSAVVSMRGEIPTGSTTPPTRLDLLTTALETLEHGLAAHPNETVSAYNIECAFNGRRVAVHLLPSGTVRGVARGIDEFGSFGVEGTSGHVTWLPVDRIGDIAGA